MSSNLWKLFQLLKTCLMSISQKCGTYCLWYCDNIFGFSSSFQFCCPVYSHMLKKMWTVLVCSKRIQHFAQARKINKATVTVLWDVIFIYQQLHFLSITNNGNYSKNIKLNETENSKLNETKIMVKERNCHLNYCEAWMETELIMSSTCTFKCN